MRSARTILLIYASLLGSAALYELLNDFYNQPVQDLLLIVTMYAVVIGILLKRIKFFYPLFAYFVIELLIVMFSSGSTTSGIVKLIAMSLPLILTIIVTCQIIADRPLKGLK